jgi:hypothetical protein
MSYLLYYAHIIIYGGILAAGQRHEGYKMRVSFARLA